MSDVKISRAKSAPATATEYGLATPGGPVLTVPVEAAADYFMRAPDEWVAESEADSIAITEEIERRNETADSVGGEI